MYKELLKLKEEKRETYIHDAPSFNALDLESYMVLCIREESYTNIASLDSKSTHSILRDLIF